MATLDKSTLRKPATVADKITKISSNGEQINVKVKSDVIGDQKPLDTTPKNPSKILKEQVTSKKGEKKEPTKISEKAEGDLTKVVKEKVSQRVAKKGEKLGAATVTSGVKVKTDKMKNLNDDQCSMYAASDIDLPPLTPPAPKQGSAKSASSKKGASRKVLKSTTATKTTSPVNKNKEVKGKSAKPEKTLDSKNSKK